MSERKELITELRNKDYEVTFSTEVFDPDLIILKKDGKTVPIRIIDHLGNEEMIKHIEETFDNTTVIHKE